MLVYVGHKLGPKFIYSGLNLLAGSNFISTLKAFSAIQDQRFKITNGLCLLPAVLSLSCITNNFIFEFLCITSL